MLWLCAAPTEVYNKQHHCCYVNVQVISHRTMTKHPSAVAAG